MAISEHDGNHDQRDDTLADVLREIGIGMSIGVKAGTDLIRQNPRKSLEVGGSVALGLVLSAGMIAGLNRVADAIYERGEYIASVNASATAVAIDNLKKDYQETGGVDLIRQQASYLVTLRGSSRFAISEGELIDNALTRIKKEGDCNPGPVVILPEVPGDHPGDRPLQLRQYLVQVANCPPSQ